MRIGRKLKRRLGFWMSVLCSVSLVACGTKYADAPALLEPVSGTESYREVSVGDVGALKIAYGSIVPTEHAVFWTTQVNVAEVLVDVGDYVEAGQVVATADLEAAQKAKQDLEGMETMETLAKNMAWILRCIELGKQNGVEHPVLDAPTRTNFVR